jgi:agmatine deiminase
MARDPAELGLRMPAEWEPHEATWLAWPHRRDDWPRKFSPIPWVYSEIIRHLHHSEQVRILVNDDAEQQSARRLLRRTGVDLGRVAFFRLPTNRSWIRDYGPIFVQPRRGAVELTQWQFNGWAKYPDWQLDNAVGRHVRQWLGIAGWEARIGERPVVLEGGSIDVNGQGLLLTTEQCLLSPIQARNPNLTREEIEQVFGKYLGIQKVLWLGRGIAGDDTHGHIDDLARFVAPRTIVATVEDDRGDINYEPLQENWERLHSMRDLADQPFELVSLPMPEPVFFAGQHLPASYANFYISNDRVLVPTFNDPNDRQALATLAEVFPTRKVVGIHATDLVLGLGTLHCMTLQQPRDALAAHQNE